MHLEAPLEQRPDAALVARAIEQVGDHHDQPRVARALGVVGEAVVEAGAAARLDRGQEVHHRQHVAAAPRRRPALGHALAQDAEPDSLEVHEPNEPERPGQAGGVVELGRGPERHRGRGVDDQVQAEILFVDEELHVQAVEPGVDVPVDVAEVVAVPVGAVVGELHAVPASRAAPLALDAAAEGPARQQRQALELREELRREEARAGGGGHRLSARRGPGSSP